MTMQRPEFTYSNPVPDEYRIHDNKGEAIAVCFSEKAARFICENMSKSKQRLNLLCDVERLFAQENGGPLSPHARFLENSKGIRQLIREHITR